MGSDLRTPIDMWPLLVWAYKRQMVHYELPFGAELNGYASSWSHMMLGVVIDAPAGRGTINGAGTTAHPDAHVLHSVVCRLVPEHQRLIIATASKGKPPEWNPDLPPWRVVPVRKGGTGKIRMISDRRGKPTACMIDYEGVSDAEAKAIRANARQIYMDWWKQLRRLCLALQIDGHGMRRWKVAEIGAVRAPWNLPLDKCQKNLRLIRTVQKVENSF